MQEVKDTIEQVADTTAKVLIRGESGTGKEVVARMIHAQSRRHEKPFVKVNCAAIPYELLESELFGYEPGAFSGANRQKLGKFDLADGGTIFLDEVSEMHPSLQAKLLHVLQGGEFSGWAARAISPWMFGSWQPPTNLSSAPWKKVFSVRTFSTG